MLLKTWSRSILPTLFLLALPALSMAQMSVNISVDVPPPELPVYDQPPIPDDGYLWIPGYWAWGDDAQDYYWVPGTWVLAPQPDYLWTPGYWGAEGVVFFWHPGYWGPHVGFYGGVNYGYGYGGNGFEGGYWQGGRLYYNRSVNNFGNTRISNVYNRTVINNITVNRASYNGGNSGVRARPTAADEAAAHDRHIAITPMQRQHEQSARSNPVLRAGENQGHPPIAATPRPGAFSGAGVVPAKHGGTMSVIHAEPQPQPQPRAAQPENRPVQPEPRASQSFRDAAPRQQQSAVESRPPVQSHPSVESHPAVEQRRQPEQTLQPRQTTPQPRPEPIKPKAEPRPVEHPQAREEDHEHH
jgi:WXXGXW repeat (2 copies)